ncbi:MAG: flagellar export protein FliJ [Spirochaetaceae bacterium]|nr:flagellar export protein FliJ [Spirochaetaceae bacterium]
MKKFAFSLQKILGLKEFTEEQAKIALAQAIANSDRIKAELKTIAEKRVESNAQRSFCKNMQDLVIIENYINRLDVQKENLLEELAEAELVIEEKRKAMYEAMKERKVLTKLKDKKQSEYRKLVNQEEAAVLDDIANTPQ